MSSALMPMPVSSTSIRNFRLLRHDPHVDAPPVGGELQGVGEVVVEDLLQPDGIRDDLVDPRIHGDLDLDVPLRGEGAQDVPHLADDAREIYGLRANLQLARLDSREVQDVVDQLQEVARAHQDVAQVLLLLGRHRPGPPVVHQLRKADDRVQGRAQLVRHVCQELALQATGFLDAPRLLDDLLVLARTVLNHGDALPQTRIVNPRKPSLVPLQEARRYVHVGESGLASLARTREERYRRRNDSVVVRETTVTPNDLGGALVRGSPRWTAGC